MPSCWIISSGDDRFSNMATNDSSCTITTNFSSSSHSSHFPMATPVIL